MDLLDYLRFLGALAFVLGLLAGCAFLLRRYGHKLGAFGIAGAAPAKRRLAVLESVSIGPRQRLALIRRDNVEHLVVFGPEGTTVVEAGIRPDA